MPEPLGFPQPSHKPLLSIPNPPRAKGRWFLTLFLLAIIGILSWYIWEEYFRHLAYGTVSGKLIDVSPPYNGFLASTNVQDGEIIVQGQSVFVVSNQELMLRYIKAKDEINVTSADIQSMVAKLKLDFAFNIENNGILVSYYENLSRLGFEQAKLEDYKAVLGRADRLSKVKAVSDEERSRIFYEKKGQEEKVSKLIEVGEALKKRVEKNDKLLNEDAVIAGWKDQLRPLEEKIKALNNEIGYLRKIIEDGEVKSPANGVVVKKSHNFGEQVEYGKPVFQILEETSKNVIMYIPQNQSDKFVVGLQMDLIIVPDKKVVGTVTKVGEKYELAPEQVKRFYKAGQHLLPVHFKIDDNQEVKYGAVVRMPLWK